MSKSMSKRSFLMVAGCAALGASSLVLERRAAATPTKLPFTPPGDLGPFYPVEHPLEADADLTRLGGRSTRALGELIEVSGRVLATDGRPQSNARIEIWQANAAGRYAHASDTRTDVPLDPNFQGYADLTTDAEGKFRFLTVKPGVYPVGNAFKRSPHIHLDVRGHRNRLVTQFYFPETDRAVLAQDKVLQHDLWGNAQLPATIFAKPQKEPSKLDRGARHYVFDVILSV